MRKKIEAYFSSFITKDDNIGVACIIKLKHKTIIRGKNYNLKSLNNNSDLEKFGFMFMLKTIRKYTKEIEKHKYFTVCNNNEGLIKNLSDMKRKRYADLKNEKIPRNTNYVLISGDKNDEVNFFAKFAKDYKGLYYFDITLRKNDGQSERVKVKGIMRIRILLDNLRYEIFISKEFNSSNYVFTVKDNEGNSDYKKISSKKEMKFLLNLFSNNVISLDINGKKFKDSGILKGIPSYIYELEEDLKYEERKKKRLSKKE